ncbi:MAG TPA: aminoglycoside phosphotransferase family protein [Cellulomonas sp.]
MRDAPTIDVDLVRRLIAEQFPGWAGLEVRPVRADGWDNRTFRLGGTLSVRLPSAAGYAPQVAKEVEWLPHVASGVPLPVPQVVGVGVPGCGYPWAWTVRRWIDGVPATAAVGAGRDGLVLAGDLARFLVALREVEPAGPRPGVHSAGRGAALDQWDGQVREAISTSGPRVDRQMAERRWAQARAAATVPAPAVWFHGDVAPGNLLLRDGRLAAVIDFGCAGVGDPACDLAVAWTTLDAQARAVFRRAMAVDDATWARGTGWALWKALITQDDPRHRADSARALGALGVVEVRRPDTADG